MPSTVTTTTPGERLKDLFERFGRDDQAAVLREGAALYAAAMVFQDPIQRLEGLDAYVAMCQRLLDRSRTVRFDVGSLLESERDVFLTWRMDMQPRLGPRVISDGVSHCRLGPDGLVVLHRDYWDLVGDVLGQVPLVGRGWRALVKGMF